MRPGDTDARLEVVYRRRLRADGRAALRSLSADASSRVRDHAAQGRELKFSMQMLDVIELSIKLLKDNFILVATT